MKTDGFGFRVRGSVALSLCGIAALALAAIDTRSRFLAFNTLKLVAATLAFSLPLGCVLGLLIARTDLPMRRTAGVLLGLLIIVPLYLQAAAWQAGFGTFGWYSLAVEASLQTPWLAGWRGAIFVHAVAAIPWVAAIVGLAARQVEPQLEEAALLDEQEQPRGPRVPRGGRPIGVRRSGGRHRRAHLAARHRPAGHTRHEDRL
jgi:iron(III) transport system permease protein